MKAASQSSRTPLLEKDAAMGMVPYMHKGETIPKTLEIYIRNLQQLFFTLTGCRIHGKRGKCIRVYKGVRVR